MKQAHISGWLRFLHAAALCVLAAPAFAADNVTLRSLSPPSGTLQGVRSGEALGPVNSVEATIRYRLESTPSTPQGFITISGEPPMSYPITMSPLPPIRFSGGNGDVRIRFSWLCNDRSPPSNPLPAITITMRGVDARGMGTGVLVQKTQPVNYTFTCRPPSPIKRPSDAALTTPGESPMQRLDPQARGALVAPDLVPVLTHPMSGTVIVRNIGVGPAPASTLTVKCYRLDLAYYGGSPRGDGCPTTSFPREFSVGGMRYVLIEIPPLAPRVEHVVTLRGWPSAWPPGSYQFRANVGYLPQPSQPRESNETNNIVESTLKVR